MTQPTVCCVMLTADRTEYAKRAVECFRAQTYENKRLLIWDTSDDPGNWYGGDEPENETWIETNGWTGKDTKADPLRRELIGELRNNAIAFWTEYPIICHWDDDDWSHPNRIAEQVALMESSGADVCGYIEMLFWRENSAPHAVFEDCDTWTGDQAWHWTGSTILGTSLCYRRAVWERFPFPDTSYGEDTEFLKRIQHAKLRVAAVTSIPQPWDVCMNLAFPEGPRMIARIHAGNTSKAYAPKAMKEAPHHWSRAPQWDEYCRKVMES